MTIYVDVLLIENLVMNYIMIYATGIILKNKAHHIRYLIGSLIGALYVILAYITQINVYSNVILKFILSIVITYIAYKPQKVKTMWKNLLIFYLTSFVFGGLALFLIYVIKPQDIFIKNGLFLGMYPLKVVLLAGVLGTVILITSYTIIKSKLIKKDMLYELHINLNGKIIQTKAMIDTGNLLKEPITNTPVVIVEHTLLYEVIPKEILNNLENIIGGDFKNIPEDISEKYAPKLKLIPFSSLGKENGMLIGIKPKYIEVINDEDKVKKENIIIAIYNKSLTKRGEFRALIGKDLI